MAAEYRATYPNSRKAHRQGSTHSSATTQSVFSTNVQTTTMIDEVVSSYSPFNRLQRGSVRVVRCQLLWSESSRVDCSVDNEHNDTICPISDNARAG